MYQETPESRSGGHVTGRRDRLDKVLVHLAVGSRSEVGRVIRSGAVTVDEKVVRDPEFKFDPTRSIVTVDGVARPYRAFYHVLLNKPAGTVTSTSERDGTPVTSILPDLLKRPDWMPVGRLDKDTEGLLLLTTDGTLAHRLTHPKWKVAKTYEAHLIKPATSWDVAAFARGMKLEEAELQPAELTWQDDATRVRVVIAEGKYHQVKRMFGMRGNEVTYLRRVAFGAITLPADLPVGAARELSDVEISTLYGAGNKGASA